MVIIVACFREMGIYNLLTRILMTRILSKLTVPNIVLIAMGASLWGFAAYRILSLGRIVIEHHHPWHHPWVNYLIGVAGFVPFFWFVFRKVSKRYVNRILALPREHSHLFAFLDKRGYLMMTFMITLGISIKHVSAIPELCKGIFFISLGLSLMASAFVFVVKGVQHVLAK